MPARSVVVFPREQVEAREVGSPVVLGAEVAEPSTSPRVPYELCVSSAHAS
jgi:hypothetical protein